MRSSYDVTSVLYIGSLLLQAYANPVSEVWNRLQERNAKLPGIHAQLERRWDSLPYPNRSVIESNFENPPADSSLFFSGLPIGDPRFETLKNYASSNGLRLINAQYANKGGDTFCDPAREDNDASSAYRSFSNNFCSVFANASSGTAFVGIPATCDPNPGSTWLQVERPTLIDSGKVKKIIRFDPDTPESTTTGWPEPTASSSSSSISSGPTESPTQQPSQEQTSGGEKLRKRDTCAIGYPAVPPE